MPSSKPKRSRASEQVQEPGQAEIAALVRFLAQKTVLLSHHNAEHSLYYSKSGYLAKLDVVCRLCNCVPLLRKSRLHFAAIANSEEYRTLGAVVAGERSVGAALVPPTPGVPARSEDSSHIRGYNSATAGDGILTNDKAQQEEHGAAGEPEYESVWLTLRDPFAAFYLQLDKHLNQAAKETPCDEQIKPGLPRALLSLQNALPHLSGSWLGENGFLDRSIDLMHHYLAMIALESTALGAILSKRLVPELVEKHWRTAVLHLADKDFAEEEISRSVELVIDDSLYGVGEKENMHHHRGHLHFKVEQRSPGILDGLTSPSARSGYTSKDSTEAPKSTDGQKVLKGGGFGGVRSPGGRRKKHYRPFSVLSVPYKPKQTSIAMMWPRLIEQLAAAHPNICIAVTDFLLFPGDEEHLQNRAAEVDHTAGGGDNSGFAPTAASPTSGTSSELRHLSNLTKELDRPKKREKRKMAFDPFVTAFSRVEKVVVRILHFDDHRIIRYISTIKDETRRNQLVNFSLERERGDNSSTISSLDAILTREERLDIVAVERPANFFRSVVVRALELIAKYSKREDFCPILRSAARGDRGSYGGGDDYFQRLRGCHRRWRLFGRRDSVAEEKRYWRAEKRYFLKRLYEEGVCGLSSSQSQKLDAYQRVAKFVQHLQKNESESFLARSRQMTAQKIWKFVWHVTREAGEWVRNGMLAGLESGCDRKRPGGGGGRSKSKSPQQRDRELTARMSNSRAPSPGQTDNHLRNMLRSEDPASETTGAPQNAAKDPQLELRHSTMAKMGPKKFRRMLAEAKVARAFLEEVMREVSHVRFRAGMAELEKQKAPFGEEAAVDSEHTLANVSPTAGEFTGREADVVWAFVLEYRARISGVDDEAGDGGKEGGGETAESRRGKRSRRLSAERKSSRVFSEKDDVEEGKNKRRAGESSRRSSARREGKSRKSSSASRRISESDARPDKESRRTRTQKSVTFGDSKQDDTGDARNTEERTTPGQFNFYNDRAVSSRTRIDRVDDSRRRSRRHRTPEVTTRDDDEAQHHEMKEIKKQKRKKSDERKKSSRSSAERAERRHSSRGSPGKKKKSSRSSVERAERRHSARGSPEKKKKKKKEKSRRSADLSERKEHSASRDHDGRSSRRRSSRAKSVDSEGGDVGAKRSLFSYLPKGPETSDPDDTPIDGDTPQFDGRHHAVLVSPSNNAEKYNRATVQLSAQGFDAAAARGTFGQSTVVRDSTDKTNLDFAAPQRQAEGAAAKVDTTTKGPTSAPAQQQDRSGDQHQVGKAGRKEHEKQATYVLKETEGILFLLDRVHMLHRELLLHVAELAGVLDEEDRKGGYLSVTSSRGEAAGRKFLFLPEGSSQASGIFGEQQEESRRSPPPKSTRNEGAEGRRVSRSSLAARETEPRKSASPGKATDSAGKVGRKFGGEMPGEKSPKTKSKSRSPTRGRGETPATEVKKSSSSSSSDDSNFNLDFSAPDAVQTPGKAADSAAKVGRKVGGEMSGGKSPKTKSKSRSSTLGRGETPANEVKKSSSSSSSDDSNFNLDFSAPDALQTTGKAADSAAKVGRKVGGEMSGGKSPKTKSKSRSSTLGRGETPANEVKKSSSSSSSDDSNFNLDFSAPDALQTTGKAADSAGKVGRKAGGEMSGGKSPKTKSKSRSPKRSSSTAKPKGKAEPKTKRESPPKAEPGIGAHPCSTQVDTTSKTPATEEVNKKSSTASRTDSDETNLNSISASDARLEALRKSIVRESLETWYLPVAGAGRDADRKSRTSTSDLPGNRNSDDDDDDEDQGDPEPPREEGTRAAVLLSTGGQRIVGVLRAFGLPQFAERYRTLHDDILKAKRLLVDENPSEAARALPEDFYRLLQRAADEATSTSSSSPGRGADAAHLAELRARLFAGKADEMNSTDNYDQKGTTATGAELQHAPKNFDRAAVDSDLFGGDERMQAVALQAAIGVERRAVALSVAAHHKRNVRTAYTDGEFLQDEELITILQEEGHLLSSLDEAAAEEQQAREEEITGGGAKDSGSGASKRPLFRRGSLVHAEDAKPRTAAAHAAQKLPSQSRFDRLYMDSFRRQRNLFLLREAYLDETLAEEEKLKGVQREREAVARQRMADEKVSGMDFVERLHLWKHKGATWRVEMKNRVDKELLDSCPFHPNTLLSPAEKKARALSQKLLTKAEQEGFREKDFMRRNEKAVQAFADRQLQLGKAVLEEHCGNDEDKAKVAQIEGGGEADRSSVKKPEHRGSLGNFDTERRARERKMRSATEAAARWAEEERKLPFQPQTRANAFFRGREVEEMELPAGVRLHYRSLLKEEKRRGGTEMPPVEATEWPAEGGGGAAAEADGPDGSFVEAGLAELEGAE